MASIGVIFDAFLAGKYAEITITTTIKRIGSTTYNQFGLNTNGIFSCDARILLITFRVIKIPTNPDNTPSIIPIPPIITASRYTESLICFLVVPTEAYHPNCFFLSVTETEKEL